MSKTSNWLTDKLANKVANTVVNSSEAGLLQFSPLQLASQASIDWLSMPVLAAAGVRLGVLRLDAVHPVVSGNKIFKLYNHLETYFKQGLSCPLASFGGVWSNHLHAMSAMAGALGIPAVGIVRGEPTDNPALAEYQAAGMNLHFVTRDDYRRRYDREWLNELEQQFGTVFWIPEGGGGIPGVGACKAISHTVCERVDNVDVIALACGTGTTLAGVVQGVTEVSLKAGKMPLIEGYCALKGYASELQGQVQQLLVSNDQGQIADWRIEDRFHCGGFARFPSYLRQFVSLFEQQTSLLLDPVYTAKLFYGLLTKIRAGVWASGTTIVAVHSGGLQGRRGFSL